MSRKASLRKDVGIYILKDVFSWPDKGEKNGEIKCDITEKINHMYESVEQVRNHSVFRKFK